jgi:hypothetical protein
MAKQTYMGQTILGETQFAGKSYFWMQDGDNVIYLVRAKPVYGTSVGSDGNTVKFIEGYVPDFG